MFEDTKTNEVPIREVIRERNDIQIVEQNNTVTVNNDNDETNGNVVEENLEAVNTYT